MKRIFVIGLSTILVACINMQVTNSDFVADKAEEIARTCPAAAQAAGNARREADRAASAVASANEAIDLLAPMREQKSRWEEDKARWEGKRADAQNRIASIEAGGGGVLSSAERELQSCRSLQHCYNAFAGMEYADGIVGGNEGTMCSSVSPLHAEDHRRCACDNWLECKRKGDALQQTMSEAARIEAINNVTEAEAYIQLRNEQLTALDRKIDELERRSTEGLSNARAAETNAVAAYEEAQRIAAEQCGDGESSANTPPVPGAAPVGFSRDVLNSQGIPFGNAGSGPSCADCAGREAACNTALAGLVEPERSICLSCQARGCLIGPTP